jgi:tetrachloro-p-hydroquinone reductive dehalogenase
MIPKLYHTDSSYYSMIARLVLNEKNVEFTSIPMDIHSKLDQFSPEYVKLNQSLTVPTLVHDDHIICSSKDILFYVNDNFEGENLLPHNEYYKSVVHDLINQHSFLKIEHLTMGLLLQKNKLMHRMFISTLKKELQLCQAMILKHPELTLAYKSKMTVIENRLVDFNDKNIKDTYLKAKEASLKITEFIINHLSDSHWFSGNQYTLADVVNTVLIARFIFIKDQELYLMDPKLIAYWERLFTRVAYQKSDIWLKMRFSKIFSILLGKLREVFS